MDPLEELLLTGPGPAINPNLSAAAVMSLSNGNGNSNGVGHDSGDGDGDGDGNDDGSSGLGSVGSSQQPNPSLPGRRCFVTVGATAGFRALLDEVTTPDFLECLAHHGFTVLDAQCGPDYERFCARVASLPEEDRHGIRIRGFTTTDGMHGYILACRGQANVRPAGCVISHGGTGTVMEVHGVGAPLIVVANPTLMDNHQLELVEYLATNNHAVQGHIGNLTDAIERIVDRIIAGTLDALPPYTPPPFPVPAAERVALFDWMVLTCYPADLDHQDHGPTQDNLAPQLD